MRFSTTLAMAGMVLLLFSCHKNATFTTNEKAEEVYYPVTEKDKQRAAINDEIAKILEDVYKDPYAYYEVNAAIYSGYYEDERVLLRDLLFPETSPLYQTKKFKDRKSPTGVFKSRFYEELNKGNYPIVKKLLAPFIPGSTSRQNSVALVPTDPELEIFNNSNGVSIYFPYSENFGSNFTPQYFDNLNQLPSADNDVPFYHPATIVSADIEADSGPGQEPYVCNAGVGQFTVCFRTKTINDAYAELKETHIIGIGAEPFRIVTVDSLPSTPISLVFLGEVQCKKQFDKFISFTGNGGGSELRFIRGDAYLTLNADQQVTTPQNVISVSCSRKDCRKDRWKSIYAIWDSNWEPDNHSQVFAIYEDDTQGTSTINASVSTTVTIVPASTGPPPTPATTGTAMVGFSIQVKTKDDIIRQLRWDRQSFYQFNRGGLNNGCGTRDGWTVYDCTTDVAYTMPEQ